VDLSDNPARLVRLRRRSEFVFVRHGYSCRSHSLVIQSRAHADTGSERIGLGFTATRKIGNAVIRNKAKRRLRHAARLLLPTFGVVNADYVFIARRHTATIGWAALLDDMEKALISLARQISAQTDAV